MVKAWMHTTRLCYLVTRSWSIYPPVILTSRGIPFALEAKVRIRAGSSCKPWCTCTRWGTMAASSLHPNSMIVQKSGDSSTVPWQAKSWYERQRNLGKTHTLHSWICEICHLKEMIPAPPSHYWDNAAKTLLPTTPELHQAPQHLEIKTNQCTDPIVSIQASKVIQPWC